MDLKITADYYNAAYHMLLSFSGNIEDAISFKFDTGAVDTAISFEALLAGKRHQADKEIFIQKLRSDIPTKKFISASGDSMEGYLCEASDIFISGSMLPKFYYYLVLDVKKEVALLGDDFISCCGFRHNVKDSIIIESFDSSEYMKNHKPKALSSEELMLALIESSK